MDDDWRDRPVVTTGYPLDPDSPLGRLMMARRAKLEEKKMEDAHRKKPEDVTPTEMAQALALERLRRGAAELARGPEPAPAQGGRFRHFEAFALMTYRGRPGSESEGQALYIWNSRDGVTPFSLHLADGREFTHEMVGMRGPYFDRPAGATHEWYTRSAQEATEARRRNIQARIDAAGPEDEPYLARLQAMLLDPVDFTRPDFQQWLIGLRSVPTMLPERGF